MPGTTPILGQLFTIDTPELDFAANAYTQVICAGDGSRKIIGKEQILFEEFSWLRLGG